MSDRSALPPDLAWAAHLVASWWGGAEPPAVPAEPDAVVARLRRNGFPLLTLAPTSDSARALLASEPFRFAIQQDRDKMCRQEAAFAEIATAWRNHRLPALFVKAMGPQPSFPYVSNNLDVLVPQARQDEARQVVRQLGYVELRHIEEPNKFLFRRFHAGESAFDLHIHGRLEWHTEFVDSAAVWDRAAFAPDCDLALFPAAEDGLLIALAHAAYENKAYKLIELAKFVYACRVLDVDWDRVADGARRRGWLPGLWAIFAGLDGWERQLYGTGSLPAEILARAEREMPARLRSAVAARFTGPVKAPVRLPFAESKRLFYEKMLADPSQSVGGRAWEIWTHTRYGARVRLRLRSQRPMLISLDGIDGSGKSAQAALLAQALEGAALRHRVVWTRGGSSRLLRPVFALGKRFLRPKAGQGSTSREAQANSGGPAQGGVAAREAARSGMFRRPLVRALWPWAMALELGATWLVRVRWPLLRGEVVVADRYVEGALVELAARLDRPDVKRSAPGRLLRALAPRPAFSYWLDVPVDVALARKDGDESAAFLARQAAAADGRRTGVVTLDATQPAADLSDRIVAEVLRTYEDRHWTLLNAIFYANPRRLPAMTDGERVAAGPVRRVLVVTNMWPTEAAPMGGIFVAEQVASLRGLGLEIDVLFVNGTAEGWGAYLAGFGRIRAALRAARAAGKPYDLVHAHYVFSGIVALGGRLLAFGPLRRPCAPIVLTQHGIETQTGWTAPLCRWTSRRVEATVATSRRVQQALGGVRGRRGAPPVVIPCGVDTALFRPMDRAQARAGLGLPGDAPLVLFAGMRRPEKRLDLIEAAVTLAAGRRPDVQLVVAEHVPHEHMPEYMNAADVLLLASEAEGSPMVVKEALACNLPVVSVDVGDVAELVGQVPGCYVVERSAEALARGLLKVLADGRQAPNAPAMGRQVAEGVSLAAVAGRIRAVYETVMAAPGGA